jgi:hypothetical protein
MFAVAVIFLAFALSHPEYGSVFYIGNYRIGSTIWRIFYVFYATIMIGFFVGSFFIKKQN